MRERAKMQYISEFYCIFEKWWRKSRDIEIDREIFKIKTAVLAGLEA